MPCLYDAGLPLALRLGASGHADVIQILLGVLAHHLAFMTANGAFDNNFGSGSRRCVHVGWGHTFQATRFAGLPQHESTWPRYLRAFREGETPCGMISGRRYNSLGFTSVR